MGQNIWLSFSKVNEFVVKVHDRMPVLLTEKQFDPRLCDETGVEYLKPRTEQFCAKVAGVEASQ